MLPDRVSNPGPLTYESGALPIALRGPALYILRQSYLHFYGWGMERRRGGLLRSLIRSADIGGGSSL